MSVMMKRRWFETVAWKKHESTTRRSVGERVAGRLDVAQHLALELADALGDGREEQVFLVAEVVVERALRDADLARDAIDRRALVAVAREAVDGRRQHLLDAAAPPSSQARCGPGGACHEATYRPFSTIPRSGCQG